MLEGISKMKRIYLFLLSLYTQISLFAQRSYSTEDYYSESLSSEDLQPFMILFAVGFIILVIWGAFSIRKNRNEDVEKKTRYVTNNNIKAFTEVNNAVRRYGVLADAKEFYKENEGMVIIPKAAKCFILEYSYNKNNITIVKVKFENYEQPLFIPRWFLRTPEDFAREEAKKPKPKEVLRDKNGFPIFLD